MNNRGAGVSFCFIAAFLLAVRYVSAAIFASGVSSWSGELFSAMLEYTGNLLVILSAVALVVGIFYLARAEKE
ncbi:MAG: DNA helicase [delta proteobacterium ML8_F1]|nr:MAG: DNA helicase [delta proteobacterium ML8_F1]